MRRHAPPPVYISHRQEKFHFSDGRRGVRFYLVDNVGNATPAVLGQERDAYAPLPSTAVCVRLLHVRERLLPAVAEVEQRSRDAHLELHRTQTGVCVLSAKQPVIPHRRHHSTHGVPSPA